MTDEDPRARRRRQDLERATAELAEQQKAKIFGVVSFHLQAGRIVGSETKQTKRYGDRSDT